MKDLEYLLNDPEVKMAIQETDRLAIKYVGDSVMIYIAKKFRNRAQNFTSPFAFDLNGQCAGVLAITREFKYFPAFYIQQGLRVAATCHVSFYVWATDERKVYEVVGENDAFVHAVMP